jgi:hypothetical protein
MYIEHTLSGFQPRQTGSDAAAQSLVNSWSAFSLFRPQQLNPPIRGTAVVLVAALGWACVSEWRKPEAHIDPDCIVVPIQAHPLLTSGTLVTGYTEQRPECPA